MTQPLKISVVGGGPGGLYFAILMKKADPRHAITVYERNRPDDTFGFGVVFSDDIGMAAAHSAGGIKARVDAHLDAGCDVVLVCHPQMVEESLRAVEGRTLDTMSVVGLVGRGARGWDGLLADHRYEEARARMATVPVATQDAGATSGAINVGDVA